MKGLNKIALVAAIAAASTAQAELVAMDEAAMAATTGQAGLTIDINSASIEIGEIAYQDEGFIGITDLSITGSSGNALDDIRMTIDVVGSGGGFGGGVAADGNSGLISLGKVQGYTDDAGNPVGIDPIAPRMGDGDLVIALRSAKENKYVDFGLNIGAVGLAAQGSEIGSLADNFAAGGSGTVLVSDLSLNGNLGPIDMVIHNDGGTAGTMEISAFFNITNEVGVGGTAAAADFDAANSNKLTLPFMNTTLGLAIHNNRGEDQVHIYGDGEGDSFAHVQMTIGQIDAADAPNGVGGLAFNLKDFSGDIDLTDITMGGDGAESIGNLYITDLRVSADMVVYGHAD